jgi:iron complex transport system ATP-binding protein
MLLDEPLANLDIPHQFEILEILSELNRTKQTTILMVIHDVSLAVQTIPKCLLLKNGRLTYFGNTQDVMQQNLISELFDLNESFEIDNFGNVRKKLW